MKIHNFRGDLTDSSTKKEALLPTCPKSVCSFPHNIQCLQVNALPEIAWMDAVSVGDCAGAASALHRACQQPSDSTRSALLLCPGQPITSAQRRAAKLRKSAILLEKKLALVEGARSLELQDKWRGATLECDAVIAAADLHDIVSQATGAMSNTPLMVRQLLLHCAVILFSNSNAMFSGYFDQIKSIFRYENKWSAG